MFTSALTSFIDRSRPNRKKQYSSSGDYWLVCVFVVEDNGYECVVVCISGVIMYTANNRHRTRKSKTVTVIFWIQLKKVTV